MTSTSDATLRQEPETGRLAQWIPTRVSYDVDSVPIPGSERWVVVWCQPGSGINMQILSDDEVAHWVPVELKPLRDNDVDSEVIS